MKTLSLFTGLMVAVCLVGCENAELVTCQQEKDALTGQLDQATAANTEKDSRIAALKAENTEMQTKTMESIQTMMKKQAEKDNQIKAKIVEKAKLIKDLKAKTASLETELTNQKGLYENMKKALQTVEQEKQALIKKVNDIQKAAVAPAETM